MDEFKKFILRGNVVDLAVGVVVGAAFNGVVNKLVSDLLTPLIAAIIKTPNFGELSFAVNGSQFMYGDFLNALISFLLTATAVFFFVVKPSSALFRRLGTAVVKAPCPACRTEIPVAATRCAACTSDLGVDWSNA